MTDALETTLGEFWWTHARNMKAEAERWNALTEGEQESEAFLEEYAESRRIRLDFAREDLALMESGHSLEDLSSIQRWLLGQALEARLPEADYLAAQVRRIERVLEKWPLDDESGRANLRRSLNQAREDHRATMEDGSSGEGAASTA